MIKSWRETRLIQNWAQKNDTSAGVSGTIEWRQNENAKNNDFKVYNEQQPRKDDRLALAQVSLHAKQIQAAANVWDKLVLFT